jgi:hypothetical protein
MFGLTRFSKKPTPKAQPKVSVLEMKAFLKKHDPFFANDLSLSRLSLEELVDYYQECVKALEPTYNDEYLKECLENLAGKGVVLEVTP